MNVYRVELKPKAIASFKTFDERVRQRVANKIGWLAQHVEDLTHESLSGDLKGFYKLRVGDYRVIYTIDAENQRLDVHFAGHRREVYKFKP